MRGFSRSAALALLLGPASLCLGALSPTAQAFPVSGAGVSPTAQAVAGVASSAAGPGVWHLSLPGKSPLDLAALGGGAPVFSVESAAVYAGWTLRWRSSEKMLELSAGDRGTQGRLVLGNDFFTARGRRWMLPRPLCLAEGAPALDAEGLRLLLKALGGAQPRWRSGNGADATQAVTDTSASEEAQQEGSQPVAPPSVAPTSTAHVAARPLTGGQIRTIVVDAGHGGKDPGARGPDGLKEKDVCLDIALRLRRELNARDPGLRVVLTRDRNTFISLQERTAIANRAKGDLFVSIHNNASPDPATHGTQVFFFDSESSDRAAADLSLRENAEANQLDILMTDLAKSIVRDQSIGFATLVQRALGATINLKHRDISYAPFYVLARTEMPAILVEVAFITNPREERLLGDAGFRQRVAGSLASGLESYIRLAEGQGKQ